MRIESEFVIHDFGMGFLGCIEINQKQQNRARTKPDFLIHDYGMEFLGYIKTIQKKTKWNANKLWFSDPWRWHGIPWIHWDNSKKNEMEYEQNQNLGSIKLAWGSLDTSRESKKRRNEIWTKSEFGIHYFGMEPLAYIERIQKKNEMEYEQNLNLGSITLAWSPLDTLRESRKNEMEYEQNLNLGSITLAWSSLDILRQSIKKRNGIRTKSEFGIHYFGMDLQ